LAADEIKTDNLAKEKAMIIEYAGKTPQIGQNVFIAPNATVIGDVKIGDNASIWYGTVIRGDMEPISIGENTNIQDNCTVHTDYGYPALIGNNVSIGHNAVIHGCTIADNCLVAINAVVLSGATMKKGSILAAGSVLKEKACLEAYNLAAGVPAKVKKVLTEADARPFLQPVKNYLSLSKKHAKLHA
jgi:carbonic anhydrase/acetyltransferase-like protein (isoleucine patch superfamily)